MHTCMNLFHTRSGHHSFRLRRTQSPNAASGANQIHNLRDDGTVKQRFSANETSGDQPVAATAWVALQAKAHCLASTTSCGYPVYVLNTSCHYILSLNYFVATLSSPIPPPLLPSCVAGKDDFLVVLSDPARVLSLQPAMHHIAAITEPNRGVIVTAHVSRAAESSKAIEVESYFQHRGVEMPLTLDVVSRCFYPGGCRCCVEARLSRCASCGAMLL